MKRKNVDDKTSARMERWSRGTKRREMAVLSEHVSTCVCVCDAVSRSETRLIRFCLIGAAPHGRVRQPLSKATTHTHTLFLLLWPWQTAWKAQIKKPIMLPWAAHRETMKSSCQNNRERDKERTTEFVQVSERKCAWMLYIAFSQETFVSAVQFYNLFMGIKKATIKSQLRESHN